MLPAWPTERGHWNRGEDDFRGDFMEKIRDLIAILGFLFKGWGSSRLLCSPRMWFCTNLEQEL
jgi:hypothetical protein